jgi:hypothetical protein
VSNNYLPPNYRVGRTVMLVVLTTLVLAALTAMSVGDVVDRIAGAEQRMWRAVQAGFESWL